MAEVIARELGVPDEELDAMVEYARTGVYPEKAPDAAEEPAGQEEAASPEEPTNRRVDNLPAFPTNFIGRKLELESLRHVILQAHIRLVTVLGPPGMGKTRLALEVARPLYDSFEDGVYFVPLVAITDPGLVIPLLASALGLDEAVGKSSTPLVTICEYIRDKKMLLLFDNFEHVNAARNELSKILVACPGVKMLVTSRERLHTQWETPFTLPALANANFERTGEYDEPIESRIKPVEADEKILANFEAIELFLDRARAIVPEIGRTTDELIDIAYICDELDCLPLAIELAAARTNVLTPKALRARLSERLKMLTRGASDAPDRQKTMRGAIDWSYSLLTPDEQLLFRRMSVFVDARLLEAIEEVCVLPDEADSDVLEIVGSLVDKSLLIRETDPEGQARFRMLRTIREYAQILLEESKEGDAMRDRHASYYAALAENAAPALISSRRNIWLKRLDIEIENLRIAMSWGLSGKHSETGRIIKSLRIAGALHWYWYLRGYIREGRQWLKGVLDALDKAEATQSEEESDRKKEALATALDAAGRLALVQDDLDDALSRLARSVQVWRTLSNKRGLGFALTDHGAVLLYQSRTRESGGMELIQEAHDIFKALGDKWGLAYALDFMGDAYGLLKLDDEDVVRFKERSLALYRELNDQWGIAAQLAELGHIELNLKKYLDAKIRLDEALPLAYRVGDHGDRRYIAYATRSLGEVMWNLGPPEQAQGLYLKSLKLFREIGDKMGEANSLRILGHMEHNEGELEKSKAYYFQNLEIVRKLNSKKNIALCLLGLAGLVGEKEKYRSEAAQIFGAAELMRELEKGLLPSVDALQRDYTLKSLIRLLGEAQLRIDMEIGQTIPLEKLYDMIEYIL